MIQALFRNHAIKSCVHRLVLWSQHALRNHKTRVATSFVEVLDLIWICVGLYLDIILFSLRHCLDIVRKALEHHGAIF